MKRISAFILAVIMIIGILAGCRSQQEQGRTVEDINGNAVSVPSEITGATSNAASVTTHIVMIAGADAVPIAPSSFASGHTKEFEQFFEGTSQIKLADGNKISAETLLASGVNVFFTTKQEEADEYAKSGIACFVLNYDTVENIAETFRIIGEVFGGAAEDKGENISKYILDCRSVVENAGQNGSEDGKCPTVYYISASTQTTPYLTQGKGTSTDTLLSMCGAELVSPGTGLDVKVNPEFLLSEDPDYILIDGYLAKEALEECKNDAVLKDLSAIKNNRIVVAPVGFFRPLLRPGAETAIGLLWLAGRFGKNIVDEASLNAKALDFYNHCLGLSLTEADIDAMLNWAEK